MAARVCAHRATVPVQLGDFGEFEMVVKRLSIDARGEVQELHERLAKGKVEAQDADGIAGAMRKQVLDMILEVRGVEFEWAPDDVEEPKTGEALTAALERFEPLTARESIGTLWALCVEAQYLSPFSVRPSKSGGAS